MKIGIRRDLLSKILFIIIVFLYAFQPALFPINMVQVLSVYFLLFIIMHTKLRNGLVLGGYSLSVIKSFIPFFLYSTALFFFKSIFDNGNLDAYIASYINMVLMFAYLVIGVAGTMAIYRANHFQYPEFVHILLPVGVMQLICVIMSYFFPAIRTFFNDFTFRNSTVNLYVNALMYDARSYGFGENLFDGFGYVTAIIIVVVFNIGIIEKNKKIAIISLLMLIMPLLNSRTGLIMAVIGILLSIFINTDKYHSLKLVRYLIIVIVAILIGIYGFQYLPEGTKSWFNRGFNETVALLFQGEITGVYKELLVNDVFFPNDVIFGAGASPELLVMKNADNGYVQFIWRYGLIGTLLFFIPYIKMLNMLKKSENKIAKCMATVLIVFFFIYSMKMYPFNNSSVNYLVFCIAFYELERPSYLKVGDVYGQKQTKTFSVDYHCDI